jgi:murein DD-endopeptidase MepM/ murein hydrolase activator NlpD
MSTKSIHNRTKARNRLLVALALIVLVPVLGGLGCAGSRPGGPGVIHHVEAGENLYRIGLRYGVPAKEIARANGIRDVTGLRIGQRLYVPGARKRLHPTSREYAKADHGRSANSDEIRRRARSSARQQTSLQFVWPVRGRLSSQFGKRRGKPHEGIDVAAARGTPIFAAESGRVIHSGRLGSYGKVVIVKHTGAYRTVYAHASKLLVRKGEFVERGQKVAEVGSTGRSSGPHVHFEIRKAESPRNPLAYLP